VGAGRQISRLDREERIGASTTLRVMTLLPCVARVIQTKTARTAAWAFVLPLVTERENKRRYGSPACAPIRGWTAGRSKVGSRNANCSKPLPSAARPS